MRWSIILVILAVLLAVALADFRWVSCKTGRPTALNTARLWYVPRMGYARRFYPNQTRLNLLLSFSSANRLRSLAILFSVTVSVPFLRHG